MGGLEMDFEQQLSGEVLELQRYLEMRFDFQDHILQDLQKKLREVHDQQRMNEPLGGLPLVRPLNRTTTNTMGSLDTMEQLDFSFTLGGEGREGREGREKEMALPARTGVFTPEGSEREDYSPASSVSGAHRVSRVSLTDTDLQRRSRAERQSQRLERMRRGSSRVSFVRAQMIPQHLKAQEAASRLTYARTGVRHTIMTQPVTWRGKLRRVVYSNHFNNVIMALIVGNAALLGIEIDVSARVGQDDIPVWFGALNTVAVCVFVCESILKLVAVGCHEFWRGEDCVWNIFDFVIVSISVAETLVDYMAATISAADGSNSFRVMRALRLARTLRGVRIIRVFRYFSALRGLILSIFSTLGSLLWTLLLLLIVFYVFSCIFTQLVTDYCRFETIEKESDPNAVPVCPPLLQEYWSSILNSMMTLFFSITGGVNWYDVYVPLRDVSQLAIGLMNLYIVIGFFTILNVVTGVFVNTAIESASADKDIATLKQMHKRVAQMESLRQIFYEIDESNANQVSIDELEEALSENKLGTFMESLGISTDDVWSLFVLIDADDNGIVDLEEFVNGCMQLHGPAKSLQVAKMSYENKLTRQAIKLLSENIKEVKAMIGLALKYRLVPAMECDEGLQLEKVDLSGELGTLKLYLDMQFEKQSALIGMVLAQGRGTSTSLQSPPSSPSPAPNPSSPLNFKLREQLSGVSSGQMGSEDGNRLHLQLPQTQTRELEDQLHMKQGELMRSSSRLRNSSRTSFVRNAQLDRHMKAQAQALRIATARANTMRATKQVEMTKTSCRHFAERVVTSTIFVNIIMAVILFNSILLGVEIDASSKLGQEDIPSWFAVVNACVVALFLGEMLLKIYGLGCGRFWKGEEAVWNIFDFSIVSFSVAETALDWWVQTMDTSADGGNSFRVVKTLRLARTLRGVRVIRLFRYFSALRALILSIFSTMGSLLWTLLLLLILFYTFSCMFTQLVTDHCRYTTIANTINTTSNTTTPNAIPKCPEELHHFSNVMDGMLTLFMSITGGIDWQIAYEPLREVSWVAQSLMNLYIVIGFFTILNVVTGVFVNTAIESASADKDIATLKQMHKRLENITSLQEAFHEMDQGESNEVSIDELQALATNKLGPFMESLGIDTEDIWGLFLLIDADHNGAVDIDEFVHGCMQLRGPAKSLQVAKMSYENKLTRQAIQSISERLQRIDFALRQKPERAGDRAARLQLERIDLSGELGTLKLQLVRTRYLDMQFEKQSALIGLLLAQGRSTSITSPSLLSPTSAKPFAFKLREQVSTFSSGQVDSEGAESHMQLPLPQTHTRDLEEQLHMKQGELMRSSSGLRDSSRTSFVRHAQLDRHLKAQAQATRIAHARANTLRVTKQVELEKTSLRDFAERVVTSTVFVNIIMAVILFNSILLGVEIDVSSRLGQEDIPGWFAVVNACIVAVFLGETLLKIYGLGCGRFWKGEEAVWNIFDFFIVSFSVVETALDWWVQTMATSADGSNSFRVVKTLRLARTLRGVRIIRLFRYFSALRGLILSIFSTMGSLLWTLLLLLILFYTFSCMFTQLVTDHCRYTTIANTTSNTTNHNAIPECPEELHYFSNVMDGMVTLFMSITGGINWEDAYDPLREVSWVAQWLMNLYIVIGFFTILNVVTGVFVNTAIESASADKDIATLKQMHKRLENIASLREVFHEMDQAETNEISIDELEEALSENKLGPFMESLGIDTEDIWGLFLLIDADHNGVVDIDEFVNGCMQLRGPAKSLQVAKMSYENKLTRQAIKTISERLGEIQQLLRLDASVTRPSRRVVQTAL
ncbi:unnamed protein product [Durusdinium trenchii]|uniref:EF-hand domain-containing protein n=1 Tax=Durusdinium trenchii TaxID=1381693 RepID=A0ABP0PMB9_9DINO